MHTKNVRWWVLFASLIIACPSLFIGMMGLNAFFDTSGGSSFLLGVFLLCMSTGFWLFPFGIWKFGKSRPAPSETAVAVTDKAYTPFYSDPYYDADASMGNE